MDGDAIVLHLEWSQNNIIHVKKGLQLFDFIPRANASEEIHMVQSYG